MSKGSTRSPFDCAERLVQNRGHLAEAEALEIVQHNDLPIGWVQVLQSLINVPRTFIGHCLCQGRSKGRWAGLAVCKLLHYGLATFVATFEVYEFSVGYAVQPGGEGRSAMKAAYGLPSRGKGLLGQVFGCAGLSAEVEQKAVNWPINVSVQAPHRLGGFGPESLWIVVVPLVLPFFHRCPGSGTIVCHHLLDERKCKGVGEKMEDSKPVVLLATELFCGS